MIALHPPRKAAMPDRRLALPSALLAAALGGACTGSNFEWSQARQIQTGMAQQQVTALMGAPTDVRKRDESEVWTWTYLNPATGAARSVSAVLHDGHVVEAPGVPLGF